MNDIDDATKKMVKAAIKTARGHLKRAELIMQGWQLTERWPTDTGWALSQELFEVTKVLSEANTTLLDSRHTARKEAHAATKP